MRPAATFKYLLVALFLFAFKATLAQPVNDECSGAIQLTHDNSPIYYLCSALNATPSMGGSIKDVWYSFTATSDLLFVRMTNSPMKYEVYSGTCGSLAQINEEEPVGGFCADLPDSTLLTIGQTYYLRVYFTSTLNDYQPFQLSLLTRHVYDECITAPSLTMSSDTLIDSLVFGSMMYGRVTTHTPMSYPFMTTGGKEDIWFKFTATDTAHTVFLGSTSYISCWTTSGFPYLYARYSGCTPADTISPVSQSPLQLDTPAYIDFTSLTVGDEYYLRLWTNKATGVSADFFVGVGPLGSTGLMPPPTKVFSEISTLNGFEIIPNPASSYIKIRHSSTANGELVISDISGTIAKKLPFKNDMIVDLSDQAPGVYFIRINGDKPARSVFVKQ